MHPRPQRKPFSCRDAIADIVNRADEVKMLIEAGRHKVYDDWSRITSGHGYNSLPGITSGYSAKKYNPSRPAPTVLRNDGNLNAYGGMHWTERRRFTAQEYSRFTSFPDEFSWFRGQHPTNPKDWKHTIYQIGNSVPPMLMRAIAGAIRREALDGTEPWMPDENMTYKEILDDAWARHLAPRSAAAPTLVSTFAGCGGSSLGYSVAGFRELLAVEWDDNAVETFRLNFPAVDVFAGDIAKLSVDETLRRIGLAEGELDVLDGSPPCQGFSTAGKRRMTDERNQLFREFGRLLSGLRPRIFVMENVSGLVKGKMKLVFVEILKDLRARGYKVSARMMNAMWYHVPQSRQRLIFIGVRDDLGIDPSHPKPAAKQVTAGEAVEGCTPSTFARPLGPLARRLWHTSRPGQTESDLDWTRGRYFNNVKVNPEKPSPTIPKGFPGGGGHTHWQEPRSLTIEEIARLTSFPDEFRFVGTFEDEWACIGNAVPPMLMRAIAEHARGAML